MYGTTNPNKLKHNEAISEQEATAWLKEDCSRFEQSVNNNVKVKLTSNQFSALVSFCYNVGEGAFRSSTLLKKLNTGDYSGACKELDRWNKGGGRVLQGLVRRRDAEQDLFSKPDVEDTYKAPITGEPPSTPKPINTNRFVITHNSWFKSQATDSQELEEGKTKVEAWLGTEFPFLACKKEGNHTRFTLGDKGQDIKLVGKNTWLLYNGHFQFVKKGGSATPINKADSLEDRIADACESRGYALNKGEYNLIGISGLAPSRSREEGYNLDNAPDKWNDSVLILKWDEAEQDWDSLCFYIATTEPGRYYVQNPLNRGGGAVLTLGLHKGLWCFGKHRGYEALVQAGQASLIRDANKNHKRDDKVTIESGNGVNLHTSKTTGWRGAFNWSSTGRWSAGCVVIPEPDQFKQVLHIMKQSPQYRSNSRCRFDFRLLAYSWVA